MTHYALSTQLEESFFAERVEKAIQLAPCTPLVDHGYFSGGIHIAVDDVAMLYEMGLTHVGGELLSPVMGTVEKFCSSMFGKYFANTCNALIAASTSQAVSLKVILQYMQNSEVGKF